MYLAKAKLVVILQILIMASACEPNRTILESSNQAKKEAETKPERKTITFEQELEDMRKAQFYFIYVIRRHDNQPLTQADKKKAAALIPGEMNRKVVADEDRAIIIGSNFRLPEANREKITELFTLEDLSPINQNKPQDKN
jgi:hypothetical protein